MSRARRLVPGFVAVVVAALVLAAPTPAPAQTEATTRGMVRLVDQSTWVDPDGEIMVRFTVDDVPDEATVEITVHEPLTSRADFARTLERERLRGRLTDPPIVVGTVGELGDTITARVPIRSGPQDPEQPDRLAIFDSGVHPVDIAVYDDDRSYLGGFVTHVVRLPAEVSEPPIGMVMVQPLDAEMVRQPDGTTPIDADTRTSWTVVVSAMLEAPDVPVVIAPRPERVAALAGGGAALDRQLIDGLAELADRHTVPADAYVEVDLDGLARAGMAAEIPRQVELGRAVIAQHLGAPTEDSLWVASTELTETAMAQLVEMGIEQVIVPHRALDDDGDGDGDQADTNSDSATETAPVDTSPELAPFRLATADGERVDALTTDALLQRHQGSSGDPLLDAQHVMADLALLWFDDPEAARVATLILDPAAPDPTFISALRAGIADAPLIEAISADEGFERAPARPTVRRLAEASGDSDLSALRSDLDLARLAVASFRSVFPDDDNHLDDFSALLDVVVSPSLDDAERSEYFVAIADEMTAAFNGIDLPERAITLAAREGTVPVTLVNDSGRPAVVAIHLDSDRLDFPGGERIEVELPEGVHTVDIPVQARASGAFPLDIEIDSPDGRTHLVTARYTIRSTAVSGLGVAISVAAVLVLGVWWVRTARRARAAHRADIDDQADKAAGKAADEPAEP